MWSQLSNKMDKEKWKEILADDHSGSLWVAWLWGCEFFFNFSFKFNFCVFFNMLACIIFILKSPNSGLPQVLGICRIWLVFSWCPGKAVAVSAERWRRGLRPLQDTPKCSALRSATKLESEVGRFQLKEVLGTVSALVHRWCSQVQSKLFHVTCTWQVYDPFDHCRLRNEPGCEVRLVNSFRNEPFQGSSWHL